MQQPTAGHWAKLTGVARSCCARPLRLRAGVYARETQTLYKRVREADEQESFLYALPKRGMWLVGSTPGSTVGGLVAYGEVRDARKLNCAWHVFDGRTWAPARGVAVTVAKGRG